MESPANCWTTALDRYAAALAASTDFQQLVNVASTAEAALKIFGQRVVHPENGNAYTKEELKNLRGYGQVYSSPEAPYGATRTRTNLVLPFGTVVIYIERLVTDEEQGNLTPPESLTDTVDRYFENRIGNIIDHLYSWLETNGGPLVRTCDVTDGPGFNSEDDWTSQGMWQGAELTSAWGLVER